MSTVINRDIRIRQGAEYRDDFQRIEARYLFEALNAGVSAASAPVFPTSLDETVSDNGISWINKGVWRSELHPEVLVWLPSTTYSKRSKIVTPVVPVDLANYTGAFQIRATVSAATPLHSGVVQFGVRSNGEFSMVISTADTAALDFERAVYDLELSTSLGEVDFVIRGTAFLTKEVTR